MEDDRATPGETHGRVDTGRLSRTAGASETGRGGVPRAERDAGLCNVQAQGLGAGAPSRVLEEPPADLI